MLRGKFSNRIIKKEEFFMAEKDVAVKKKKGMSSKEEAAAWELIKFLEGEYVQTYRLETGASFPSNLNVDVNKLIDEKGLEPFVAKRSAFYNSYTTTPVIDGVLHSDVYNEINVVLQEIGLGACTPAQGAARVQKAWETWKANN